ncbi:MAG: sortase [Chloroflexota bacterium]
MRTRRRSSPLRNLLMIILLGGLVGSIYVVISSLGGSGDADTAPPETAAMPTAVTTPVLASEPGNAQSSVSENVSAEASGPDAEAPPASARSSGIAAPVQNAQIIIPSIAVNAPVVQTYLDGVSWDVSTLGMNVGHLQGTSWMSEIPGNIVLSGHVEMRDGRQGVFSGLDNLQPGDLIILQEGDVERRYVVVSIGETAPDDLAPVRPTLDERLTLITCDAYDFFSDSYLERTVVVATPIG